MSPWPRMRPATRRAERLKPIGPFADAEKLDRQPSDRAHRERSAPASIAVGARQHKAGQRQTRMKALGGLHRVLTGEAVADEQNLLRFRKIRDGRGLIHHLVVERCAARGVEDQYVMAAQARGAHGALSDLLRALAGDDRQHIDADLLAERGELLHRRGRRVSSEAIKTRFYRSW